MSQKALLVILDGWGHGKDASRSAIAQAEKPNMNRLYAECPNAQLVTFGEQVGLPEGQMGNSEVGHLNIGAGRIVYQDFARINKAIADGDLPQHAGLLKALHATRDTGKALHLIGLLSDGGVHSHINHLKALCDIAQAEGLTRVYVHAFMDGRDTAPMGGKDYLRDLQDHIQGGPAQVVSMVGRYYAMDRDQRWERVKLAYDLLVHGKGEATQHLNESLQACYDAGETDEFIKPLVVVNADGQPLATIQTGDTVLFYNFRTDRPRELTQVLTQQAIPEQELYPLDIQMLTMTRYDEDFTGLEVLFTKDNLCNTLGEVLSDAGKTQVRIAETEKYPHVTFFFSGGREATFEGESRIVIPSPKVATYDLQPEMSAPEVTAAIIQRIEDEQPDFICLNYANTDMVGHTGVFSAAVNATETVDRLLGDLLAVAKKHDYACIIIADHGNSDIMINEDGSPHTAHTTNLVPVIYTGPNQDQYELQDGKLADIAPTILHLMGIEAPEEMTGEVLLNFMVQPTHI